MRPTKAIGALPSANCSPAAGHWQPAQLIFVHGCRHHKLSSQRQHAIANRSRLQLTGSRRHCVRYDTTGSAEEAPISFPARLLTAPSPPINPSSRRRPGPRPKRGSSGDPLPALAGLHFAQREKNGPQNRDVNRRTRKWRASLPRTPYVTMRTSPSPARNTSLHPAIEVSARRSAAPTFSKNSRAGSFQGSPVEAASGNSIRRARFRAKTRPVLMRTPFDRKPGGVHGLL